jgi:aryl-phospho-beta-D-glucosidase BglC (GH1 family)
MAGINYSVGSNWGSGFVANMTVGADGQDLAGWTIEFDASFDITNFWGAEIVSHIGDHYVISNADWNANVAAGGQASFGFQATAGAGGTALTGLVLDGAGPAPPPPLPTISIADASASEGNSGTSPLAFTVTLSQAATGLVTVHYATADGTATAGSDYTAQSGTLSFAAGETSKTIVVPVIGDTVVEPDETLTVVLSAASGATIAQATATGTIVNDDVQPPSAAAVASLDYTVVDNWGSGFTGAMRVGAGNAGLDGWTVGFDSSAAITNIWNAVVVSHVGNHYVVRNTDWNAAAAPGGIITFGFQATSTDGDTAASGFTVNGAAVGPQPPALPTLAVADSSVVEGNSGIQDLAFTVRLSAPATSAVTVAYATADGSAKAGNDYIATSGTLTFAAGQTSGVVHVQVVGDTTVEGNETLALNLSSPNGAIIADGTATGTIINDDVAPPPPLPGLSISNTSVVEGTSGAGGAGWLSTAGNQIVDAAGTPVQIAGVNWFGFESSNMSPDGLWARNYKDMMNQMVSLGFNTIRLPFSTDTLHSTAEASGINYADNPDLAGLTPLQVMDKIVDYAGQVGLKIILDHHRSDSGAGTQSNGLWYDANHSQAEWISDWQMLAERYADDPQVIGADLQNEPYNGTWGDGGPNDWPAAATAAGNAIGAVNPNWLIFVEGIGTYAGQSYWWGGNLMGVKDHPIVLDQPNKLVYSPHDYPDSVYPQPWFQGADFPGNLPAKFTQMWGYIYQQDIAPVYLGEFGTNLTDPKDTPWLQAITAYLGGDFNNDGIKDIPSGQYGPSWTFWSWNPNSGDTGGILNDDWTTVNQTKVNYLKPIEFSFDSSAIAPGGNAAVFQLTLSTPAASAVTVNFHTVAGTADSGDFTPTSGSVTFAPGQQTQTISIPVTLDTLAEPNEQFTVVLSGAAGATITNGTGTATIIDDVPTPATPPPPTPPATPPVTPPNPPATSGGLGGQLTVTDSWSGGFNASVDVHNGGTTATAGWQIAIDMPYQITNIWNATIVSHDANGYVIASAPYNGQIGANGDTSFGFTADGQVDATVIDVHNVDAQGTTPPPATPTPPVAPSGDPNQMFSPYIDMAMTQDDNLVAISQASGIQNFTLAFMLGSSEGIGWQGQGTITDDTLANGSTILQQVQAIQALGGDITISFGGAAGQEAALTAPDATTLQAEYQSVIDRYHINSIDFDIEGAAEANQHSLSLRDQALVGLEAANPGLKVSFTVPVLPTGLDASGLNVLQAAKNDGVRIDTVNIMAMDYGQSVDNNGQMGRDAIDAADATELQLANMGLVAKIGVTPMIGVNDITSEVFTPADAQSLVDYAKTDSQLALLSMWSVARDNGSGAAAHTAAPDNSGVAQQPYQYAGILQQFDHG